MDRKYSRLFSKKTKSKPGPKGPSKELIRLVCRIKQENPGDGYPRIADIVNNTFGQDIEPDVIRRILQKYYHPGRDEQGPSWLTFIGAAKDSLWSMDFFGCESTILRSHFVLIVMDQFTRKIIGFSVRDADVTGIDLCVMFNEAIVCAGRPKYVSHEMPGNFILTNGQQITKLISLINNFQLQFFCELTTERVPACLRIGDTPYIGLKRQHLRGRKRYDL